MATLFSIMYLIGRKSSGTAGLAYYEKCSFEVEDIL